MTRSSKRFITSSTLPGFYNFTTVTGIMWTVTSRDSGVNGVGYTACWDKKGITPGPLVGSTWLRSSLCCYSDWSRGS